MKPDVVVDIGNSRIKWGLVSGRRITEVAAFDHDDPIGWKRQIELWELTRHARWALAGVVPAVLSRFEAWLTVREMKSITITNDLFDDDGPLDLVTAVEEPNLLGVDRLLTAYAAWKRAPNRTSAVAINVGTAMTIDFVESFGMHRGGAILPGPRMMARSLHQHTALLPEIDIDAEPPVTIWGEDTEAAIELGIASAILGAADQMVWDWASQRETPPVVFATGGDVGYFRGFVFTADVGTFVIDPTLTLDGIRRAAEALP